MSAMPIRPTVATTKARVRNGIAGDDHAEQRRDQFPQQFDAEEGGEGRAGVCAPLRNGIEGDVGRPLARAAIVPRTAPAVASRLTAAESGYGTANCT
jgi:hypothetical protein